jgi:integrase/recombinase XerD
MKTDMINKDVFISKLKEEGVSEATLKCYLTRIKKIQDWLCGKDINSDTLEQFKKYMIANFKPKTVCVTIAAINRWLEFSERPERLKNIKLPKETFRDNVLSYEDYKKMLRYCLTSTHMQSGFRYYCIIKVLGTTGIRISELQKITYDDYKRGYADIISKANHARRVFIPEDTCAAALQYCDRYKKNNISWVNNPSRSIGKELKIIADLAGVNPDNVYPHAFRHLFAKKFLEKNSDISLLADILGHQSINTTQIYTRKTSSEQEQAFRNIVKW